ncbi:MAG TPA: DUF222 domain-containing protein [Micromonosporaceae bacterium]
MLVDLAAADAAVRACVDAPVWTLPEQQLIDALDAVHMLEQRLAAVKLELVREVDGRGVAVAQGASSTAVWLRERLRLSIAAGRRLVADATALNAGPAGSLAGGTTAAHRALAAGAVTVEHARVIADTVAMVHAQAGAEAADKAARMLVDWAGRFEPGILRGLSARILAQVAPEVAEEADRRALVEAEARADRDRQLTLSTGSPGQTRLTARLDAETAALLHTALEPLCAPTGVGDDRTPGQRRHDALAEICRLALRSGNLPDAGGDATQVVVTTSYEVLRRELRAGALDTGTQLSPGDRAAAGLRRRDPARRARRQRPGPRRRPKKALVHRPAAPRPRAADQGCAFPGCDRPPRWTEGHHIVHWADGGETSLHNSVLLCRHHHRHVHHHDWQVRIAGDGHPEFLPPAWLDPQQRPRRNQYHRRT